MWFETLYKLYSTIGNAGARMKAVQIISYRDASISRECKAARSACGGVDQREMLRIQGSVRLCTNVTVQPGQYNWTMPRVTLSNKTRVTRNRLTFE